MRNLNALAIIILATAAPQSFAADETCDRLRAFELAPFDRSDNGKPGERYVEVHWIGNWSAFDKSFRLECRSSGDAASKGLCAWLSNNTSYEFSGVLPVRILRCSGHDSPQWYPWVGTTKNLKGHADDRILQLEVDFRRRKTSHEALRLRVIPDDVDPAELAPLVDPRINPPTEEP